MKKALMNKYRKKPLVIEARQYDEKRDYPSTKEKARAAAALGLCFEHAHDGLVVPVPHIHAARCLTEAYTLEGLLLVSDGDWIIRGVKGELYPCKPDIFAATYEPAD